MQERRFSNIDPFTTVVPLVLILALCLYFVFDPASSTAALDGIRGFLGDQLGVYYLVVGLGVLLVSLGISLSKLGDIRLGGADEKPKYPFWAWGSMLFTSGLAADILFYSMCEWILYTDEPWIQGLGLAQDWTSTIPLFHWGPIPWGFYATLAAAFGFMLHVRGSRKEKYSEACRPILGEKTERFHGRFIDVLAVLALIAGTATTFSVATPLLSEAITTLVGIGSSKYLTIGILVTICIIYTLAVLKGIRGIELLAKLCMYIFLTLLVFVLVLGGPARYIIETGFSAVGNLAQNFMWLSTRTDPLRTTTFTQDWTIFYWAYWMVWCVAAPFFMGKISRGRTVRQVILGAYAFGLSSTFISFIVLGNYGLGLQMTGELDILGIYAATGDLYHTIIATLQTLPFHQLALVLLVLSMVLFYATSFDSITLVASSYSYREMGEREEPSPRMKLFWSILLILLPIALIFNESSMSNLQTVSIIAAFPIGIVIILIIASFIKDARRHLEEAYEIPPDPDVSMSPSSE